MLRYARQIAFSGIGEAGQRKLLNARVAVVGVGALGTVTANCLVRAGVGHLRLIDRDYVEITNLQRQILYTEEDAAKHAPKTVCACEHLSRVNADVRLEPVVAELNAANIEQTFDGIDLVLDAVDNWESRFLVNEICLKLQLPWIYCAALGAEGMTMNFLPGENPCLRCFTPPEAATVSAPTCVTAGVLNMATGAIASIQAAEAVKILTGSPKVRKELLVMDFWNNTFRMLPIERDPDCPVCVHRQYEYAGKAGGSQVSRICGRHSIQVTPATPKQLDLETMATPLLRSGKVDLQPFMLTFETERIKMMLFQDGRAFIEGATDEGEAKSIYAEYVGT